MKEGEGERKREFSNEKKEKRKTKGGLEGERRKKHWRRKEIGNVTLKRRNGKDRERRRLEREGGRRIEG